MDKFVLVLSPHVLAFSPVACNSNPKFENVLAILSSYVSKSVQLSVLVCVSKSVKLSVLDDVDKSLKLYSQVKSLKVKTYNFKSTPDITQHGFLAHEAKDVWDYVCDLPKDAMKEDVEGGTKDTDGNPAKVPDYQQLDYAKFTPMIMGALQKAMEKIETLETKVETLEAKVKALEEA